MNARLEHLKMSSTVSASPDDAWQWITSLKGISAELSPWLRMSAPDGVHTLADLAFQPGKRLFRSTVYLLGFLPVDHSDLTLLALNDGKGFVEQSPMGSMRTWRHERLIEPLGTGCKVTDSLRFEPRFARGVSIWLVKKLFAHRHRVLRKHLGEPPAV